MRKMGVEMGVSVSARAHLHRLELCDVARAAQMCPVLGIHGRQRADSNIQREDAEAEKGDEVRGVTPESSVIVRSRPAFDAELVRDHHVHRCASSC
jgi:hypothetical protein